MTELRPRQHADKILKLMKAELDKVPEHLRPATRQIVLDTNYRTYHKEKSGVEK